MANREIEHEGGEERPVRALTCFNILRAVLLYVLDLMLALVLLPRGTPVTLRNICIIFGKFLMHVAMMTVTYAFYLACISNANVAPHGPISLSINRMLGLPDNPNCRNRRGLEDSWDLLRVSTNSTSPSSSPASVSSSAPDFDLPDLLRINTNSTSPSSSPASISSSAPNLDLPDLDVNLTKAFVNSSAPGDSASSTTIAPQINSTWSNFTILPQVNSTWSNFTTDAPGFFNDSFASTTEAAFANKTSSVGLLFSPLGLKTSSSANVTIFEGSSTTTTTEPTPPVTEDLFGFNLPTSNLTLGTNGSSVNASTKTTDELWSQPWFTEEEHKIIEKILSLVYGLAIVLILILSICCAGLGLVTLGERRGYREANKARSLELRPVQQVHPSRGATFEPATDSLFRPIPDRDSSSFAPLQPTREEEL